MPQPTSSREIEPTAPMLDADATGARLEKQQTMENLGLLGHGPANHGELFASSISGVVNVINMTSHDAGIGN